MIPKLMEAYLRDNLPTRTWTNRLTREGNLCFMEFSPLDVDRLARLGISVDNLGPRLVVCMWNEASPLEIGGYIVIDNLAMGRPSMGGIRMLPDISPSAVYNLARGMTLKNAAANLPFGGGKAGIVSPSNITAEDHIEIIRGFARLIYRYRDIYLPGPDVGTNDEDMGTIAIEYGLDNALSKPANMGGNMIDQLGAAAGGCVIALEALLEEMPRLKVLEQFVNLQSPQPSDITILIQGFGAVGAHFACILQERIPDARVVGVSDLLGYLYNRDGLPTEKLFSMWRDNGLVTSQYFRENLLIDTGSPPKTKYSTSADDLLRETAFCLIPASPISNYLNTERSTNPSMTVDRMGNWVVIIEGANTYSPDPNRKSSRARMERDVYRQRGVLIATDYLVNSGGVIFAAQEHLIKTPNHLRIPDPILGDRNAIEYWLSDHKAEFAELSEERLRAGEDFREEVIKRNMRELIDVLISDADMLPCEASELISVQRIAKSEQEHTAADIMVSIPTIKFDHSIQEAAELLIDTGCSILAVLTQSGELAGVVTEWDITKSTSLGSSTAQPLENIMTRQVISAKPSDSILDMILKLEHYEISAMPIVDEGSVQGMVSTDLLARRSLYRLLQSQTS